MNAIKRIVAVVGTAGLITAGMVMPVSAVGGGYGSQPGYDQASDCGAGHGSFGYFNGDTNLGVNSLGPGTPVYHDGAVGQEPGATGSNNSNLCGDPQAS